MLVSSPFAELEWLPSTPGFRPTEPVRFARHHSDVALLATLQAAAGRLRPVALNHSLATNAQHTIALQIELQRPYPL
jgi:hypothetical protein